MHLTNGLVSLLACIFIAGCADSCPDQGVKILTQTRIIDNSCVGFKPIYLDKADVLTDATAQQILEHDRFGASKCGWKPAK